jgi:hypothetical protein
VKAIFEERTTFTDSLFYDVSGFNLALSFNMPYGAITGTAPKLGNEMTAAKFPQGQFYGKKSEYAYVFRWDEYYTPRALNKILEKGLVAKVANKPFSMKTGDGVQQFGEGTIMVPVARQSLDSDALHRLMHDIAMKNHLKVYPMITGMPIDGVTLGSPSWSTLKLPKTMLVVGNGVSSYDAGEVWHLFDQRYEMPISKVTTDRFERMDFDQYNTIIMVNGGYSSDAADRLRSWLRKGNTLIVYRGAISWAKNNKLANIEFIGGGRADLGARRPYNKLSPDRGRNVIGGAIFETEIDVTNPLFYGYHNDKLPVFHRGTSFMKPTKNAYATPSIYSERALINGYVSKENLAKAKGTAAIIVNRVGGGKTVCLGDNTNFRAFWYGTNKILMNAVFFGRTISSGAAE